MKNRKSVLKVYLSTFIISFIIIGIIAEPVEETRAGEQKRIEIEETATNKEENGQEENPVTGDNDSVIEEKDEEKTVVADTVAAPTTIQNAIEQQSTNTPAVNQATDEQTLKSLGLVAATVSRVIDGDTVELSDGNKVRLIGVNTPESTTRTEPYGKEASDYTKSKLEGKQVYLQKDVSETDRYGRLLRLVWLDVPTDLMDENEIRSKMFNADLVLNGYAQVSTYPPDVTYAEHFRKFEREARENNAGLWAIDPNGTTKGDYNELKTQASSSSNASTSNSQSSASSTTSSSSTVQQPAQKEYFKNCTELRKVYPNGVPADHPAYRPQLDRDKDGWACER